MWFVGSLCVYMVSLRKANTNRNSTMHNQAVPDGTVNMLQYIGTHTSTLI